MQANRARELRRRFAASLAAFAASLAIHGLLLVLAPPDFAPPRRPPSAPFTIELRDRTAEPPASASRVAATGPPRRSHREAVAGDRPHGDAIETSPDPTRAIVDEGIAPGPEATPDLHARPPRPAPPRAKTAGSPPRVDPLAAFAEELASRARVEDGLVHPYYREVGRALLRGWNVERAVRQRGLSGYLAQAGDNTRTYLSVWQRMAEGFARTGSPAVVDGGSPRMKELSGLPAGPARDALVQTEIRRQLRPALSEGHSAIVRVTQAADGSLISVVLVSPSRDADVDRAAIEDVRAAARMLPKPPADAFGGRDRLVSLWELELEVSITPPLPIVGVEFDEVRGITDLRVPLDRRIWKRVRLVALK